MNNVEVKYDKNLVARLAQLVLLDIEIPDGDDLVAAGYVSVNAEGMWRVNRACYEFLQTDFLAEYQSWLDKKTEVMHDKSKAEYNNQATEFVADLVKWGQLEASSS